MSRPARRLSILVVSLLPMTAATASSAGAMAGPATTVSPGELDRAVEIATACPTFTWGAVAGAARIELAVLALAEGQEPQVVLRRELPGSGSAWTPARADCLAAGSYAWSVRGLDAAGRALDAGQGWAATRRFLVPAAPSRADVAAALDMLRRWQASEASELSSPVASTGPERSLDGRAAEASGTAAIRGENAAASGSNHGVWGQSASASGGGLVGVNSAGGPDLVLDGAAQSQADANLTQGGIDRPSASAQTFNIENSGAGAMTLQVDGVAVSVAGHAHAGEEIASGTVADARVAATLTRDSEVMSIVLAADGPGSTLNADLLDGLHGQNYQRRVTGVCAAGETLQGINSDGTVVCTTLIGPPVLTEVLDESATVGIDTALAIGTDGFPIIAHRNLALGAVLVTKCNDPACVGGDETTSVVEDVANSVGAEVAIAIGTDGFPVMSYQDQTADSLKVAKCNDPACAGGNETITTIDDPVDAVGRYSSIAIGSDGFPVVSYWDETAGMLKVAKCNDAACAGGNETISVVDDPANLVGRGTSIAVPASGLPVISYHDATVGALKVAKCNDVACAGGNETITTVDAPVGIVARVTAIRIGTDGYPVVAYSDDSNRAVKVVKCNDAACSGTGETISTVDDRSDSLATYLALAIGSDGFPVIAYDDSTVGSVIVAKCNDPACDGRDELITTVDNSQIDTLLYIDLAIGADGLPVLSYYNFHFGSLRVAKCQTRSCFAP